MDNRIITENVLEDFLRYLAEEERSRATIEKYRRDIRHFMSYASSQIMDKSLMLRYKAQLEQDYAVTSANSMLAALNTLLRYCDWHDLCVRQFKVQRKAYCSEEKELTRNEYVALIQAAKKSKKGRLALLLQTVCSTGIRVSELQYITVEAAHKGEVTVTCKGKIRKIFLVSALRKKLISYAKEQEIQSGMIFVTKNRRPLDRSNIWREMKGLCQLAGVSTEKVFPHNLRHLFARIFYEKEKDMAKLADILGHSNINTTRIYILTTGAEHRCRMEQMHLII